MPTPLKLTFDLRQGPDGTPPVRPTLAELGGGLKTQSTSAKPDVARHITAPDVNQWAMQLAALGGMAPNARLTFRVAAGVYTLTLLKALSTIVTIPTFTITKVATGRVRVAWASGTFPTAMADHVAWVTGATLGKAVVDSTSVANQVDVWITNDTPVAADLPFVLDLS